MQYLGLLPAIYLDKQDSVFSIQFTVARRCESFQLAMLELCSWFRKKPDASTQPHSVRILTNPATQTKFSRSSHPEFEIE